MWAWTIEETLAEIRTNSVLNSNSLIRVFAVQIDDTVLTELELKHNMSSDFYKFLSLIYYLKRNSDSRVSSGIIFAN
jgi:hypothetical protein